MTCVKTQQRMERSFWLLNESTPKVLIKLTLPMLPAIIAIFSLDLFDTYLAATLGTESLAALSFTIPVTSILFAIAIGLSIGNASILSFTLGKGDHHKAKRLTTDSLLIACSVALLVGIIGLLTIKPLFVFLGANYALIPESFHMGPRPDIMPLIAEYMQYRYIGFVFMLLPILTSSIMRATGDTQIAGWLMFSWASVTAIIDGYLMLFHNGPGKLADIALGHLIADIIFSVISLIFLIKRENLIDFHLPSKREFINSCRDIFSIALPAGGMSLLPPIALAIITNWVAFYGREAVAVFGVIARIESLALFIPMTLSTALPIFVGQNFGAGKITRSTRALKQSLILTIIVQLIIYWSLFQYAQPLAALFSNSAAIIKMLNELLVFLPFGYIGLGCVIVAVSTLNAIHRSKAALMLSITRIIGLLIPAAFIGAYSAGLNGLYMGLLFANITIGLVAYFWVNSIFKSIAHNQWATRKG